MASTGRGTKEDPLTMPWFEMSEAADQFITVANGFIDTLKDFDWTKWIEQPEGQKLSCDRNATVMLCHETWFTTFRSHVK